MCRLEATKALPLRLEATPSGPLYVLGWAPRYTAPKPCRQEAPTYTHTPGGDDPALYVSGVGAPAICPRTGSAGALYCRAGP
eukprot:gene22108-biopygen19221